MKKSNTYHNTTNQNGKFFWVEVKKCKNQEERVMQLMQRFKRFSASEVWDFFPNCPITSVRRALSNLTHEGILTKEDKTKIGLYGRAECYYTLNESNAK